MMFDNPELLVNLQEYQKVSNEILIQKGKLFNDKISLKEKEVLNFVNELFSKIKITYNAKLEYGQCSNIKISLIPKLLIPKEFNLRRYKGRHSNCNDNYKYQFRFSESCIIYVEFSNLSCKFDIDKFKSENMHFYIDDLYVFKKCFVSFELEGSRREVDFAFDAFPMLNLAGNDIVKDYIIKHKPTKRKIKQDMENSTQGLKKSYLELSKNLKKQYSIDIIDINEILKMFKDNLCFNSDNFVFKINATSYVEITLNQRYQNRSIYSMSVDAMKQKNIFEVFDKVTANTITVTLKDISKGKNDKIFETSFFILNPETIHEIFNRLKNC